MDIKPLQPQKFPCVILCGGRSRRFGHDKIMAGLAGKPVLEHVIDRVSPQCSHLALANFRGKNFTFKSKNLMDERPDIGPLSGVLSAMEWAKNLGFKRVFTSPADTPFIPNHWAQNLMKTPANTIAIARSEGKQHRVSALWPVGLSTDLRGFLSVAESPKVGSFIRSQTWENIEFSKQAGFDPFFNINTAGDLEQAKIILKG